MMRALLLVLVAVALAGCADGRQWAGVAEAWMYEDSGLVMVQLHRGTPGQGASEETARLGMERVQAIEDATATFTLRNGTNVTRALEGWTLDRENDTAYVAIDLARFDGFRLNATFVLDDGARLPTSDLPSWTEQYRRPYSSTLRLDPRATQTQLTLSIYQVRTGARAYTFDSVVEEGTLIPVEVRQIADWSVDLTAANGTTVDRTPPSADRTVRATLPAIGVTRAEPRYTLVLDRGIVLTDRDVDNDVFPDLLALQQRLRQEN